MRENALSDMLDHADLVQEQLNQNPPDSITATLHFTDDPVLHSYDSARWQPGIPLRALIKHFSVRDDQINLRPGEA